ncbi:hypothetical protein ACTXT7_011861 [Hymenolepis weldensis]
MLDLVETGRHDKHAEVSSMLTVHTIAKFYIIVLDFVGYFESLIFNSLSEEVKALSVKFEGSKHADSSITSMHSVPSSYSIKPASVEIADPAAADDVTKNVPEFIHYPKSGKFLESKLSPIEYERYPKFVLSKEFNGLNYSETIRTQSERSHLLKVHHNHHVDRLAEVIISPHVYSLPYHSQSNGQTEQFVTSRNGHFRSHVGMGQQKTTPHPALNDRSPAETHMGRKPRTIHNAFIPKDSTFHSSFSCAKKTHTTYMAVYVRYHGPNGTWVEDTVRTQRGSVIYEWMCMGALSGPSPPPTHSKITKLETGPLDIIFVSHRLEVMKLRKSNPTTNKTFARNVLGNPLKDLRWI